MLYELCIKLETEKSDKKLVTTALHPHLHNLPFTHSNPTFPNYDNIQKAKSWDFLCCPV